MLLFNFFQRMSYLELEIQKKSLRWLILNLLKVEKIMFFMKR